MFDTGAVTLDLPLEEKLKYEQGDSGASFGYVICPRLMSTGPLSTLMNR